MNRSGLLRTSGRTCRPSLHQTSGAQVFRSGDLLVARRQTRRTSRMRHICRGNQAASFLAFEYADPPGRGRPPEASCPRRQERAHPARPHAGRGGRGRGDRDAPAPARRGRDRERRAVHAGGTLAGSRGGRHPTPPLSPPEAPEGVWRPGAASPGQEGPPTLRSLGGPPEPRRETFSRAEGANG